MTLPISQSDDSDPDSRDAGEVLARALVADGAIDELTLQRALRVHSKLTTAMTLVGVLKKMGLVDEVRILDAVRNQRPSIRIGELLTELGYLDTSQLRQMLNVQQTQMPPVKLGELLVNRRLIKSADLTRVLASQLGFEHEEPEIRDCDDALLQKLMYKTAIRFGFLPIRAADESIVVGFSDPQDQTSLTEASRAVGAPIHPVMISPTALERALAALQRRRNASSGGETQSGDLNTASGRANRILSEAIVAGASDIHVEPLKDVVRVRFRIDGVLREQSEFDPTELDALVSRLKIMSDADIAERRLHQDGRIQFEDPFSGAITDLRVSFYVTVHGESVVIRVLNQNSRILSVERIGITSTVLTRFKALALERPSGVILVTGPTGSGKTSTLYSCIQYLNDDTTSIITVEDPVEYQLDGISQCSVNLKAGRTFAESLRHMVRQDPDVIVIGEIRDALSAQSAIQAALTGHKVLTTFHTEDSVGALLRLQNMDIETFLICSTVVCVLAQRLIRRVCGDCAVSEKPDARELQLVGWTPDDAAGAEFVSGSGCETCEYTGYQGRVGIFEALMPSEAVRDAILDNRSADQIRTLAVESAGLVTLLEDGLVKAARGETSLKEVRRALPRLRESRPLRELRRLTGRQ